MFSVFANFPARACAVAAFVALSACTSVKSTSEIGTSTYGLAAESPVFKVCSGYGCIYKDKYTLSKSQERVVVGIMQSGSKSPEAERKALARAVSKFEKFSRQRLRYAADVAFSYQKHAGKRGQMDCVDESLNTTAYLQFLENRGLLKYHTVFSNYASRGLIIDGRYPHKSARIRDKSGKDWAVDSWKGRNGVQPTVTSLASWYKERNSAEQY